MTDKELLELAAKAIGLEIRMKHYDVGGWHCQWHHVIDKGIDEWIDWNPLTDDSDALRLAVKLGLDVCIDTQLEPDPSTHVVGFPDHTSRTIDDVVHHNGDPYAATRRAITRAAAEIGKAMKS